MAALVPNQASTFVVSFDLTKVESSNLDDGDIGYVVKKYNMKPYYAKNANTIERLRQFHVKNGAKMSGTPFDNEHLNNLIRPASEDELTDAFLTTGVQVITYGFDSSAAANRLPDDAMRIVRKLYDNGLANESLYKPSAESYDCTAHRTCHSPFMTHHAAMRQFQVLMNGHINRLVSGIKSRLMRTDMVCQALPVKTFTKNLRFMQYPYFVNKKSYRSITTQKLRQHVYGDGGFLLRGYTNMSDDGIVIELNYYLGTHMYGPINTSKSMARGTEDAGDSIITAIEVYASANNAKNSAFTSNDINLPKATSIMIEPGESILWDDTLCTQQIMIKRPSGTDLDAKVRLVEFGWRVAQNESKPFHQLFNDVELFQNLSLPFDSLYGIKVVSALPPMHDASEFAKYKQSRKIAFYKQWVSESIRVERFIVNSELSLTRIQNAFTAVRAEPSASYPPYSVGELSDRDGIAQLSSYPTVSDYTTDADALLTQLTQF